MERCSMDLHAPGRRSGHGAVGTQLTHYTFHSHLVAFSRANPRTFVHIHFDTIA